MNNNSWNKPTPIHYAWEEHKNTFPNQFCVSEETDVTSTQNSLSGLQSWIMFQLKGYEEERWEEKLETELFKDVFIHNESLKSRPGFSLLEL